MSDCYLCGLPDREPVITLENSMACEICVEQHRGPGKFEAYRNDPEALGTVLILYQWMLDGSADESMSNGYQWCDRFGKYLLYGDDRGFVEYQENVDATAATKQFEDWYSDGMGASEDDAYIFTGNRGWEASFEGKHLNVPPYRDPYGNEIAPASRQRALAAIRLEMCRTGCYPNVWEEYGYGVRLVKEL